MLRDYQHQWVEDIYAAWGQPSMRNVVGVMPTGGGKSSCISHIVKDLAVPAVVIAHRNELVSQLSLTLTRDGVPHGIIAPDAVIREIVRAQMETYKRSMYSARAPVRVAGVNTLAMRKPDRWFEQVQLAVMDEGHHTLRANIFGKVLQMFPNAKGLLATAHAERGDGAGLGRAADGLADTIVLGPTCRELIDRGFLCDYRLICPPNDLDLSEVPMGTGGEYSLPKLRAATHKSKQLVGDIAKHYLRFAEGKLGLTFAVDVESATEIKLAFEKADVRAELMTGETPIYVRSQLMRKFQAREIHQLVSCEVLGEGVDVPAVEVASLGRATGSFQLFGQQDGRTLRTCITDPTDNANWNSYTDAQRIAAIARSPKPRAIIIDHVGNFERHGLPDVRRIYSLDRAERKARAKAPDRIPQRTCLNPMCFFPYPRVLAACPLCGTAPPPPARRSAPEYVDGDLFEMDPSALAALRLAAEQALDAPRIPYGAAPVVVASIKKNHREKCEAVTSLRAAIGLYGGWQRHMGRSDSEAMKRFYFTFGYDIYGAQRLNTRDSEQLESRIRAELNAHNVVEKTV